MEQLLDSAINRSRKLSAFKGHLMKDKEEKQKEFYIKLLLGSAEHTGMDEKKTEFLYKLANGIGLENPDLYLARSDNNSFEKILKEFDRQKYGDMLLADMLILTVFTGNFNEKNAEFMNDIFSAFGIGKKQAKFLIGKAQYILLNTDSDEKLNYPIMFNNISSGSTSVQVEIRYTEDKIFLNYVLDFRKNGKIIFDSPNVHFLNCRLAAPNIEFNNNECVKIEHCKIEGKITIPICLKSQNVQNFLITNCEIENIDNKTIRPFEFNKISNLTINDNRFKDCYYDSNALIYMDLITTLEKNDNLFERCGKQFEIK